MSKTTDGYKKNSKYKDLPFIDIPSNRITTKNVEHDIIGISDEGHIQIMKPNKEYQFRGRSVLEIPLKQEGGLPITPMINMKKYKKVGGYAFGHIKFEDGGLTDYLESLSPEDQDNFVSHLESLSPEEQQETIKYMCGGKHQMGGTPEYPRYKQGDLVELEDGESLKTPEGNLFQVTGNKHSEGGEKMSLPEQTQIYSEFLKAPEFISKRVLGKTPKKELSYADLSKKFPTQPYLDTLEDNKDLYKVETAKIKLETNRAKLETIFAAQEMNKKLEESKKLEKTKKYQLAGMMPAHPRQEDKGKNWSDLKDEPLFLQHPYGLEWLLTGQLGNTPESLPEDERGKFLLGHPLSRFLTFEGRTLSEEKGKQNLHPIGQTKSGVRKANTLKPNISKSTSSTSSTPGIPKNTIDPAILANFNQQMNTPGIEMATDNTDLGLGQELTLGKNLTPIPETKPNSFETTTKKKPWEFGIDSKLAGTILDIGLTASDKLHVNNPTLYDRRKYPLFNRFIEQDDKEVSKMYGLAIQQIQRSNMPQQVKDAKISEILAKSQDYQAKVEFTNLQRYEQKKENDLNKLQSYMDQNIETHVQDLESFRAKMARIQELKDTFRSNKKSRIINSIKDYTDYIDKISYANQLEANNYQKNPITGKITFKETPKSKLDTDPLSRYNIDQMPKIDLGDGATGFVINGVLVTRDKEGRISTTKFGDK